MFNRSHPAAAAITTALAVLPTALRAQEVLWDNGPIITNHTGGTGAILGLPISNCDGFTFPGNPFIFSTTGVGVAAAYDNALAEDFTVPPGFVWFPTTLRLSAFRTSTTVPPVTAVKINLWTAPPFNANSPAPLPTPLPTPMFAQPVTIPVTQGAFICHRQSVTSTSTNRPVHEYVVDLTTLPVSELFPGTYWIEFSLVTDALTLPQNVHVPLVSPRTAVTGHNARQYSALDGQQASPRAWFEGREGYQAGVTEGRAVELPFILEGHWAFLDCTGGQCGPSDFNGDGDVGTDQDIEAFFACLGGNCCPNCFCQGADFNGDGDVGTDQDIESFFRVLGGGNC